MQGILEPPYTPVQMKRLVWLSVAAVLGFPQIANAQIDIERSWESLLNNARDLAEKGRLEEALEILIRTRQVAEKSGADAGSIAITMNDIGSVYHTLGRYSDAEKTYASAIRLLNSYDVSTHSVVSRILNNQASLYMDFGRRFTDAERLRRRALELRIAEVGPEGPGVATLLSNLGSVCLALGRFEEAAGVFRRALDLAETTRTQGATTVGSVLQNLATLYGTIGRDTAAADFARRAVASLEKVIGEDHPDLVRPLVNLARVQIRLNRPLLAEAAVLRAQRITEARLGPEHPFMVNILLTHENILRRTNRKAEARAANRRVATLLASNPDLKLASSMVDISDLVKASRPRQSGH
jgi:tetratricopeptide (TPR) repeat protein